MSMVQLPDGTWVRRENVMSIGLMTGAHGERVRVTVVTPLGITEAFLMPEGDEAAAVLRDRVARSVNGTDGLTREGALEIAGEISQTSGSINIVADILMEHFA